MLFVGSLCFAQKEKIAESESRLATMEGADFVSEAVLLSDLYLNESMFDMANRRAEDAYEKAKSIGHKNLSVSKPVA